MKLSVHPYFLEFIHPFALAHGTRTGTQLAFVKIEYQGIVAYGEASLPPYRNETFESVKYWVESKYQQTLELISSIPIHLTSQFPFSAEHPSASAALQMALLNWQAKLTHTNLFDIIKQTSTLPALTLTITKNDFDFISEKLKLANHFNHFKLKLTGHSDDIDFVKAIRKLTDLPFCIDINQGCNNQEDAIQLISTLEQFQCKLIEQPLNNHNHEGHYWLKQRTPLPIIADESIALYTDLVQYHEAYSGVNIKLMKCGGLMQAQQMVDYQPENNSSFMKLIGCMSESSLGVAAAAAIASQCQMADLDAPYLNINDPFKGFQIWNGKIVVANQIELIDNKLF